MSLVRKKNMGPGIFMTGGKTRQDCAQKKKKVSKKKAGCLVRQFPLSLHKVDYKLLVRLVFNDGRWIPDFDFNLVSGIFGDATAFTRVIYALVGLSGLYMISLYGRACADA